MVVFEKIKFKNINSVGNYFVEIPLNKYKNIVFVGENGTGKTTVLQAITFSLYGKPFTDIKIGSLINSVNKKNLEVEIEFSKGSTSYRVKRGLKPDVFEIYRDGILIKQDSRKNDYQETLNTILGFDFKVFTKVIILGSAVHMPFMQLKTAERRELVEKLLDLEVFSSMNDYSKKELKNINELIKNNENDIYKIELNIETKEKYKKDIATTISETIEGHLSSSKTVQEKIATIVVERNTNIEKLAKVDIEKYEEGLKDFQEEFSKIHEDELMIVAENNQQRKTLKFLDDYDVCPTCNQLLDEVYKKQIQDNVVITSTEGIKAGLVEVKVKIDKTKGYLNKIQSIKKLIDDDADVITAYNKEIKFFNDEIAKLNKSVSIDYDEEIATFRGRLKEANKLKDKLNEDKTVSEVAIMLLKDDGIKASVIKKYVGMINSLLKKHLETFDFFINFTLNENFEEEFKSRHVDKFSYMNFSEGEKKRIDLALLLTLKEISKRKNNVSSNLLAFDETLERIDEHGADCFVKMLRSSDTNNIIISHADFVINKFNSGNDCVMKVIKSKKFSYYEKL